MRRKILSCLVAIFCVIVSGYALSTDVRITVQVQNASTSALYIQAGNPEGGQLSKTHRIDLTNGYAQFAYPVGNENFIELIYNGYTIPMYVLASSSPTVAFDAQNIMETLQFSGDGSTDNNFIAAYYRNLGGTSTTTKECAYMDILFGETVSQNISSASAGSYASLLDDIYQKQINLLSKQQGVISNEVYNFYKRKASYDKESQKLNWLLSKRDQLGTSELEAAKNTLRWSDAVIQNGAYDIYHPAYQNLLKAAAIWKYLPNDIDQFRTYTKIYPIIEQQFSGSARCYLSSHLLVKVYEKSGETELGRSKISQLSKMCPQYTDQIMEMYGGDISGVENIAAPEMDMVDKNGTLIALDDYRGQVVYVSFWASWCKPCIAGFKKSKGVRQQLQDMGVVLINISIDKKEEAWRDAMIRYNPLGINTWAISLQDLAKDYDISSIPLYHIVNKQGKFAYLSDQGGRNITEEFRTLVEQ